MISRWMFLLYTSLGHFGLICLLMGDVEGEEVTRPD